MRSVLKASRRTMKVSLPSLVIIFNCISICLMVGCKTKMQSLYWDTYIRRHLIQDRSAWFLSNLIHFFSDSFQVSRIFSS